MPDYVMAVIAITGFSKRVLLRSELTTAKNSLRDRALQGLQVCSLPSPNARDNAGRKLWGGELGEAERESVSSPTWSEGFAQPSFQVPRQLGA